jgi:phenylalanyl-tRNA synthetase beta chain
MKVLLSWLREFAPFEDDPVALGETMSQLGMAVESLEELGGGYGGIVVARVLATRPHPDADRVHLVDVDVGDGNALQVVCGAFNMEPGDLVPLATVGTTMPDGMEIARRRMRGEWSNGMLCSSRELHLGDDHAGIMILPPGLAIGAPFAEAMGIERDVLYDLEINPNRPDAMSVAGVARDVAAKLRLPFTMPSADVVEDERSAITELASVEIVDPELCGRFVARVLRGVTVGPSERSLATRLTLLGMRPISSLVDVSNYVMLELGQPNHPYDLAKLPGGAIRVRRAKPDETLVTLDEVERSFTEDDLLICDGDDRAIGIAGVMGGADTEIDATTTDVLLEMAWFEPMAIAKTSRRLRLRSEASARFEKGCDPEVIDVAMRRFAQLLEPSGARLVAGAIDRRGELPARSPVRLRTDRVNAILGTAIARDEARGLLEPIGFQSDPVDGDLEVIVPPWRYDCAVEIDVIEEVARHYGYDRIGRTVPPSAHTGRLSVRQLDRRRLRRALMGLDLSEAMPMPFLAPGELERFGLPPGLPIANPLVSEESVLRTSLLPGLVAALAGNARHRNTEVGLFEIGHVFLPQPAPHEPELPDEREHLGAVLGGGDAAHAVRSVHVILRSLDLEGIAVENGEVPGLHPTRSARLVHDTVALGAVGEIDPDLLREHGVDERVGWFELDLDRALALPHGERAYRQVSFFPSADIDLAFEVDESVPASALAATLRAAIGDRLWSVRLFDVYRGPGIADGRRSLAYALRLQAPDRTLTDDDIAELRQRGIDAVAATHGATLRG